VIGGIAMLFLLGAVFAFLLSMMMANNRKAAAGAAPAASPPAAANPGDWRPPSGPEDPSPGGD
jgi:hypothetical protein